MRKGYGGPGLQSKGRGATVSAQTRPAQAAPSVLPFKHHTLDSHVTPTSPQLPRRPAHSSLPHAPLSTRLPTDTVGKASTRGLLLDTTVLSVKVTPAREGHKHQKSHCTRPLGPCELGTRAILFSHNTVSKGQRAEMPTVILHIKQTH